MARTFKISFTTTRGTHDSRNVEAWTIEEALHAFETQMLGFPFSFRVRKIRALPH